MPNIIANDIKVGNIIEFENQYWKILSKDHVKPGKGGAFIQTSMKAVIAGTKKDARFRSSETVMKVILESVPATFMYKIDEALNFMYADTYEQTSCNADIMGERLAFLQDGMEIKLAQIGEEILDVILPDTVILEVVETQPYLKGQTITASFKAAKLSNGLTVNVPQFLETGEKIVVKTDDLTYVERAK